MMLLKASVVLWISVIRTTSSSGDSDPPELWLPPAGEQLRYRPWEHNETAASASWISLAGMGFENFGSSFRLHFSESPQWLVLDGNKMTKVSAEAFETLGENLTYVSLAGNGISQIETAAFDYLEKLRVLDLDGNPVDANQANGIPCNSASLERLYLRRCGLSSFNLPSCENGLTDLHLSENEIAVFYTKSDSFLTHLYLDYNQMIYVTLSQLDWLIHVDVSHNRLNGIARLSQGDPVKYAEDFQKRSRSFWNKPPDTSRQLYLDRAAALQYLIASFNYVSEIEIETFADMYELVHVDLSGNKIGRLRAGTFKNLFELQDILLDGNRIAEIERGTFVDLPKLKLISLKNNRIENFEADAFEELKSLTNNLSLFLDNNEIHTLGENSFRGVTELRHVGLAGNRIITISSQAFADLPNLRSLAIENQSRNRSATGVAGTEKGSIESKAFSNLSNLVSVTIRGNSFAAIEAQAFNELPNLTILDLYNNTITNVSSRAFNGLPKIEELNLGCNELFEFAPDTFPKHLKRLNVAWNKPRKGFADLDIAGLDRLEELDISGTIESFSADELSIVPKKSKIFLTRSNLD